MVPHADNPLFICLLLLLKYGHRSFVLSRRNTDQHNVGYVQFTCSPNYRLEPKCSNEARLKKKVNRSLTCKQWINLCSTVAYTLNLQILFGYMYKSIAGYLSKRYSTLYKTCWLIDCWNNETYIIVYLLIWNDFLTSNSWYNCRCLLICILTL